MTTNELNLDTMPAPPLFKLVDDDEDVFERAEVGGEMSTVGALFATHELAKEFSENAEEFGMGAMQGLEARKLPDWNAVES